MQRGKEVRKKLLQFDKFLTSLLPYFLASLPYEGI
jgi:hypothetical protein